MWSAILTDWNTLMRLLTKKILGILLPMAALLISNQALAHEQSQDNQASNAKQELSVAVPDVANIIPLADYRSKVFREMFGIPVDFGRIP